MAASRRMTRSHSSMRLITFLDARGKGRELIFDMHVTASRSRRTGKRASSSRSPTPERAAAGSACGCARFDREEGGCNGKKDAAKD